MKLFYIIFFLVIVNSCFSQNEISNTDIKQCEYYYDSTLDMDIYRTLDKWPEFPGGESEMFKFIAKNWNIPRDENRIQTSYVFEFIITQEGEIINIIIDNKKPNVYTSAEKNLAELLKKMPIWKPGKCNGKNVNSFYRSRIRIDPQ